MNRLVYAGVAAGLLGLTVLGGCSGQGESYSADARACQACPAPGAGAGTIRGEVISPPGHESRIRPGDLDPDGAEAAGAADDVEAADARAGQEADRNGTNARRIRDIGIRNLSRDGNIWIGGEPTDRGYEQIRERGVTAVVDLRNPTAVQRASAEQARRLGLDYINLPIEPKNMDSAQASRFLDFMEQHEGQQVLIHCGSANRASGMYAVYLGAVKGLSIDEALQRARGTGLREAELENDVRRFLETHRSGESAR